jgi:hypothetical protein
MQCGYFEIGDVWLQDTPSTTESLSLGETRSTAAPGDGELIFFHWVCPSSAWPPFRVCRHRCHRRTVDCSLATMRRKQVDGALETQPSRHHTLLDKIKNNCLYIYYSLPPFYIQQH